MPVEFLTDERAAAYGRFGQRPSRTELERFCFLDDADLGLINKRRGNHSRLGFALQLVTVRATGAFLSDPLNVPTVVLDDVAAQLGIADPSVVKRYAGRRTTRFEHQAEIMSAYGYRPFAAAEDELAAWVADRSWTSGDGPTGLFDDAVAWLRQRQVLLPGLSTLVRLVARVREETTERLHATLAAAVPAERVTALLWTCEVPEGARVSPLEEWSHRPRTPSGLSMVKALDRVSEIAGLGLGGLDLSGVPVRRVTELGRYGLAVKAPALRRHPYTRKVATLLATVHRLEATAVDDALELFDLLMTTELAGKAERQSRDEKVRRYPRVTRHAGELAAAVRVLFEAREWGEEVTLPLVWDAIENVVPASELRATLVSRYRSVRGFVGLVCQVIAFDATPAGAAVLTAMRALPELVEARPTTRVPAGYLDARKVALELIPIGWWQRLVLPPDRPTGTVHKAGYVFCLLEQFHRLLLRSDIFAPGSTRWTDPRARLLAGPAWAENKTSTLNALGLSEDPEPLLARRREALDAAWRHAAAGLADAPPLRLDEQGRLHAEAIRASPDPPSLIDLRKRVAAMLPEVDLPELILEVMSWQPEFAQAFTAASGGPPHLADAHISIAAALTAQSLNIGYSPIIDETPALTRARLSYIDQNYLRPENYSLANAGLIDTQDFDAAGVALAGQ